MPMLAVSSCCHVGTPLVLSLGLARRLSTLDPAVADTCSTHVLRLGYRLKMVRIHTETYMAQMVKLQAFGNRPNQ